jgi:peptide/nickel transport system permease protein
MTSEVQAPELPAGAAPESRGFQTAAWIGASVLGLWVLVAIFAPLIAPYGQGELLSDESFALPGGVGLLGGDYLGRDILSRVIFGARMTLGLAAIITVIGFAIGIALGFLAAVAGGVIDTVLSRSIDAIMAFPSIMLALIIIASLGSSMTVLILTIAAIEATRVFRVSRSLAMDIAVMDFVEVARARGEGLWWIMLREIFPNATGPLAAEVGIRFTYAILFISALSFLGLGVQPPNADWGSMVRENLQGLLFASWAPIIPAAAIATVTFSVNLIVDWYLHKSNRDISDEILQ